MFCPQCGQQQAPDVVRFCSRCGFPLDGVLQLLANGGMLPAFQSDEGGRQISARQRGVKQGGILLLSGVLLVPILGVLNHFAGDSSFLDLLVALAALLCFVGGPLRMLYAGLFEEGAPAPSLSRGMPSHPMPLHSGPWPGNALPVPERRAPGWSQRPRTAELVRPPSVTEGTTRLLDKDDPVDR